MVIALVDSSIVIDLLCGYANAVSWYSEQTHLGISGIVWQEIIGEAPGPQKRYHAIQLLSSFSQTIDLTANDAIWAVDQLREIRLSDNTIDIYDCLIASANARLNIPLYTRNLKHFAPLLGPLAQVPYT